MIINQSLSGHKSNVDELMCSLTTDSVPSHTYANVGASACVLEYRWPPTLDAKNICLFNGLDGS